jgi:two-component system, sensor histidine kinase and response regulator
VTKVLVIEDAKDLRDDVVEMLSLEGYDAEGAENGVIGVRLARELYPDLIVCDIMMPELDGYGVLQNLRATPDTATIPFIFLTAKTDRVDMRQGMVLGADDYLTKPFRVTELLDSIRVRLGKIEELEKAAAKRIDAMTENIMTALPHELRTPLNTIIGFSEMLNVESQMLEPEVIADWSQHINVAAHRLYRLVENYLFYARLEVAHSGNEVLIKVDEARMEYPLSMVEMMVHNRVEYYKRHADLVTDYVDTPAIRMLDLHLNKIVEELVDNAFKFTNVGETVTITTQVDGKYYIFRVKDEGRGMTHEDISSIGAYMQFQRWFFEQQGMGLGLAIVKLLVKLYGGELNFVSLPTPGLEVEVKIPLLN